MCEAFDFAVQEYGLLTMAHRHLITPEIILEIASLVEPEKASKYREIPITINSTKSGAEPIYIARLIESLCEAWNDKRISPEEFYLEFETIHPFLDGNGRVGAILYNIGVQSLRDPINPPEYTSRATWGDLDATTD